MKKEIKQHFIGLLGSLKVAALLTASMVVLMPFDNFFGVAVFVVTVLVCSVRVKTARIFLKTQKLVVLRGLLFKSYREIPFEKILCIVIIEQPIAKLFSASLVRINTVVAEKGYKELKFVLCKSEALELAQAIFNQNAETGESETPKPLLAAMSSTIAMAFAVGLPLLGKIGAFFGRAFVSRNEQKSLSLGKSIVVCGTQMLVFKQIYCRRDVLCEIKISQSVFDLRRETCSVKVSANLGRKACAKVRRIDFKEADRLLQNSWHFTHKSFDSADNN